MTDAEIDEAIGKPRMTTGLFGHSDAEIALLDAYRSGRMHHAWMIGGPRGIGKATLAYRMARFVLAHPDPDDPAVRDATSLAVDAEHPVTHKIAARSHGDLLVLKRTLNEKGKMQTVIPVAQVRRAVSFFGSTAGEGGWRVCIIDTIDEVQMPHGANALLKVLEEPPRNALLLLISNAPGQLLPTIRSRVRRLTLRPLATEDATQAVALEAGADTDTATIREAVEAASGSVGRALDMLAGTTLTLRKSILDQLARLPRLDDQALHGLGEQMGGTDPQVLAAFLETLNQWISEQVRTRDKAGPRYRLAEAFAAINAAAHDADTFNLERKPLVFNAFERLAEAMRD